MIYWGTEYNDRSDVKRHKFTISSHAVGEHEGEDSDRGVLNDSEFKWTWEPNTNAYLVDPFPSEIGTKPGLPDNEDRYYDDLIYESIDAALSAAYQSYGVVSSAQDVVEAARNYLDGRKQEQSATYHWDWGKGDTYPVEADTLYHFIVRTEDDTVWFESEKWHGLNDSRYNAALVGFRICKEGVKNSPSSTSSTMKTLPDDQVSKEYRVSPVEPQWYHIDDVPMNHQRRKKRKEQDEEKVKWGKEPLLIQSYTTPYANPK